MHCDCEAFVSASQEPCNVINEGRIFLSPNLIKSVHILCVLSKLMLLTGDKFTKFCMNFQNKLGSISLRELSSKLLKVFS